MSSSVSSSPSLGLSVPRGAVTASDGLILVDKPAGISSHDVVAKVRRLAATRKVGHAGTLDPMATGLLLLGIGRATRFLTYLVGADKTYDATIRLGQETLTEDAEGEVTASAGCRLQLLGEEADPSQLPDASWRTLRRAMDSLVGDIMQVPSAVSAIKINGVRSYKRVRDGENVDIPARPVTISRFELCGSPRDMMADDATPVVDIDVRVACSSGTYVRALARDLGRALGCGAHLTALRRVAVGPFVVEEAATIPVLGALVEADAATDTPRGVPTLSLEAVARRTFPSCELAWSQARAISYGQRVPASEVRAAKTHACGIDRPHGAVAQGVERHGHTGGTDASHPGACVCAGFDPDGHLVALLSQSHGMYKPVLVLRPAQAGS